MHDVPSKIRPNRARLLCLLLALATPLLFNCGLPGPLAGGSSEMGNPNSALYGNRKSDSSLANIDGVQLNAQGFPIDLVRKSDRPGSDSTTAALTDSAAAAPAAKINPSER